ncbi:hypothetical protein ACFU6R_08935 [Streptomyces sp. NPDC057499]|uniref:hypothetical protein n=1 Tax=Streptomyces sp. NPDC057499 TaxID=3346150 RepID=UPI0036B7BD47
MSWIEKIEEAISWQSINLRVNWSALEAQLGSPLPSDFKEICESFGRGQFSGYLEIHSSETGEDLKALERLSGIQRTLKKSELFARVYEPYGVFSTKGGQLIPWAESVTGAEFYWLTESKDPDKWPTIARPEDGEWSQFPISTSEFIYRMLTEPDFEGFGIADMVSPPFYELY